MTMIVFVKNEKEMNLKVLKVWSTIEKQYFSIVKYEELNYSSDAM